VEPKLTLNLYNEFQSDFISITRLDSDDLMHEDTMAIIKDRVGLAIMQAEIQGDRYDLTFQKYLLWDTVNRYIRPVDTRKPTLFFTHVFPKRIYQDWSKFRDLHFTHHIFSVKDPVILPDNMICVTDHHYKISRIKRGKNHQVMLSCVRRSFLARNPLATGSRAKMVQTLKPFGIHPDYIVGDLK